MNLNSKIYLAGHTGLVGSSILNNLKEKGYTNILVKKHSELDLLNQKEVELFFKSEKPEYVILAAARVGGIVANNELRADFIYENLTIQNNVIHQSYLNSVKKLLFLGSTCIYPKEAKQPITENYLMTGSLEFTNEPYAIAKIAGIKMCEAYNIQYNTNFISVMPSNLYGPNDNFDFDKSHVLPALIRKMHLAKLLAENKYDEVLKNLKLDSIENAINYLSSKGVSKNKVNIWGTGKPRREFLYSEDLADACVFLLEKFDFIDMHTSSKEIKNTHVNIGTGEDISIKELSYLIKKTIGFNGELYFDTSKPDGTMKKLTDVSKLSKFGWEHKTNLDEGIKKIYNWYLQNNKN